MPILIKQTCASKSYDNIYCEKNGKHMPDFIVNVHVVVSPINMYNM